jgi:acyl carrier protein
MEKIEILDKLTLVFRRIFNDNNLILTYEITANHIENWDSLTHMLLITEIENTFSIKFKLKELNKMRNVGDIVEIISEKI